jgi:hypothetical protein
LDHLSPLPPTPSPLTPIPPPPSVVFLYTNNEQTKEEIRKTMSFTIGLTKIKNLGIDLTKEGKEVHDENFKSQKKEVREDIRR